MYGYVTYGSNRSVEKSFDRNTFYMTLCKTLSKKQLHIKSKSKCTMYAIPFRHKITLDRLTCHLDQSELFASLQSK